MICSSPNPAVKADRLSNAPKECLMLFEPKCSSVKADRLSNAPEGMPVMLFESKYSHQSRQTVERAGWNAADAVRAQPARQSR